MRVCDVQGSLKFKSEAGLANKHFPFPWVKIRFSIGKVIEIRTMKLILELYWNY